MVCKVSNLVTVSVSESCQIEDCLLCDATNSSLCSKCEYFLSEDLTSCLEDCPGGTSTFDHTHETYLGPKCTCK